MQVGLLVGLGFRYRFNPVMLLLFLLFFSVFSALSLWQVSRVYFKQSTVDEIEFANQETPLSIKQLSDETVLGHLFYRASATGQFRSESCFFVENVVFDGQPGMYVYCPFDLVDEERWLLVNMGWIKRSKNRLELPDYKISEGSLTIEGVIKHPRSKPVITSGVDKPNTELENLWVYFDFESLKQQSGVDFYPIELQLTSDLKPSLHRQWPEFKAKIGMHVGYAIHWAAFALATLILFIKFNFRKVSNDD